MTEIVGADSPLRAKIVPSYPVAGKRILLDNGNYLRALMRPNVELVTDPIREITETGVVTASGARHDADILIYGTGFQASRFLWPMKITGREGVDLQQHWAGDPRAYMGITIPGFPNLFCCYGPNTNIVVNGSIIFFSECEVRYILGCMKLLISAAPRRSTASAPCTTLQPAHRRGQPAHGLGRGERAHLVQERQGAGHAELAVHLMEIPDSLAARLLAAAAAATAAAAASSPAPATGRGGISRCWRCAPRPRARARWVRRSPCNRSAGLRYHVSP